MDEGGQRENRKHRMDCYKVPPWNAVSQYQLMEQNVLNMNARIGMLCDERNAAIQERDRAIAEKKAALDERDAAIQQRDIAIADRNNALRERDNAIAALQFHESTMNSLLGGGVCGLKRTNHPINHRPDNVKSARRFEDGCISAALPISIIEPEVPRSNQVTRTKVNKKVKTKSTTSPRKVKKMGEDLNRGVTADRSKAEWDAREFGSMKTIHFDESTMAVPVCSCTGVPHQCYKWGNGGWQSSCCTTSLSVYPLPQMPNKKHARMGGRKMSGSVYSRLLTRFISNGHDLSVPLDLKNYWAKHGTNRYITIK